MAKKLRDIKLGVERAGSRFKDYLREVVPEKTFAALENLSQEAEVFVFSGVIRNFFLRRKELRDLDLVIKTPVDISLFFKGFETRKNSFGGYKLTGDGIKIDVWFLDDTWAFHHQPAFPFDLKEKRMPSTAFFNFSAIIYSFNTETFHANPAFFQFLQNRKLDLVYEPNANYPLCVINTFYYQDTLACKVSGRLKKFVIQHSKDDHAGYALVQERHFGRVIYSDQDIENQLRSYAEPSNNRKVASRSKQELPLGAAW